jgi:hypothetical protein
VEAFWSLYRRAADWLKKPWHDGNRVYNTLRLWSTTLFGGSLTPPFPVSFTHCGPVITRAISFRWNRNGARDS